METSVVKPSVQLDRENSIILAAVNVPNHKNIYYQRAKKTPTPLPQACKMVKNKHVKTFAPKAAPCYGNSQAGYGISMHQLSTYKNSCLAETRLCKQGPKSHKLIGETTSTTQK